ncbi:MAG: hypothetical protein M3065_12550 [Actinomycetota bacterium]|nr:hypothetical protein [Actinomycetota bacterium]
MTTKIPPRRFLLIAATATSLALAGCGSSSSTTSSGLSRAQLAVKVNAACRSYDTAANAIPQPNDFATNPAAAAAYLDKLKKLANSTFVTVTALQPDSSVKSDFTKYVADETRNIGYLVSADAKAHAKDPSGLKDLEAAARFKSTTIVPLDRKLGFTSCIK